MGTETHKNKPRDNRDPSMPVFMPASKVHPSPYRFTVQDYVAMGESGIISLEDRVELIDGQVVEMSPIGNWHLASVRLLTNLLNQQVPAGVMVDTQNGLNLGRHDQIMPDLMLIPTERIQWDRPIGGDDVLLIIEVAESSLEADRHTKLAMYAEAGIPEYWIVDLNGRAIEVYREPEEGGYASRRVHSDEEAVSAERVSEILVQVVDVVPPKDTL